MNDAPAPKRSFQRRTRGPERILRRVFLYHCARCGKNGTTLRRLADDSYVCAHGKCTRENVT